MSFIREASNVPLIGIAQSVSVTSTKINFEKVKIYI